MKSTTKFFTGLALVLSVSLNANATFGPATVSYSDSTGNSDMENRSTLLLAVADDVNDDINNTDRSPTDDNNNDDNKNDDNRNDDNSNDDHGNDDNSNDDNVDKSETPERPDSD
ncbi:hypothetical protein MNBD_GAMMA12-507 [hydrothermal vent metagenome]|uniref:Uncharacterized protein n=1 Tax=hydrothermal vent metagenome TaxID=652676 RepID=A0A3B0Y8A9_9ZZZZ